MIKNFSDHAANERTFLAWVRTAIAVMAFGFLVEKFDLFLEIAAPSLGGRQPSVPGQKFANFVGLALIVVGTGMVAVAGSAFCKSPSKLTTRIRCREQAPDSTWHSQHFWFFSVALSSSISPMPLL